MKKVKLETKTILAVLCPVMLEKSHEIQPITKEKTEMSHEDQLKAVLDKGISLQNCASTGDDFRVLVDILYIISPMRLYSP